MGHILVCMTLYCFNLAKSFIYNRTHNVNKNNNAKVNNTANEVCEPKD